MYWWRAMLPRRPDPVPQPEFPEAPAPPVRGFLFGRSTKKPGLTWPGFPLRSGTQSGACSPELPRANRW